jgi:hypothetical protein
VGDHHRPGLGRVLCWTGHRREDTPQRPNSSVSRLDHEGAAEAEPDGTAETDGAADAGTDDLDPAGAADGAADPEADGEPLGGALSDDTGDGVGRVVRNPPCPPSRP